jgi:hypothetical protein
MSSRILSHLCNPVGLTSLQHNHRRVRSCRLEKGQGRAATETRAPARVLPWSAVEMPFTTSALALVFVYDVAQQNI